MENLLIVTPHFPPSNTPDMQRVRMSLPHYGEFGWAPTVLAVAPDDAGRDQDPLLLETVPPNIPVHRVGAFPVRQTRKFGLTAIGLRAFPFLYHAGSQIIRENRIMLVFFSTTAFPVMTLGRIWKRQWDVPYIFDMQDPWVGDYYEHKAKTERPPKYGWARRMHTMLEPFAMQEVSGIVAVSEAYHQTLRCRYSQIREEFCLTLPFGTSQLDFEVASRMPAHNPVFNPDDGYLHGVNAGALGRPTKDTCRAICVAFRAGLERYPELFRRVRLHFIGTSYAVDDQAGSTLLPIVDEMGLKEYIQEIPHWLPYFQVLRMLQAADFLIVPGKDNPQYTASKIYPYILAKKPLLAIFHEQSSVVHVIRTTRAGVVVPFTNDTLPEVLAENVLSEWTELLKQLPYVPDTDWQVFEQYTAREMTRRQCELFDRVVAADPRLI